MADSHRQKDRDAPFFRRMDEKRREEHAAAAQPKETKSANAPVAQNTPVMKVSIEGSELDALLTSVNDSARHVRGLYFTFLLFAFYVAVIVFSTTDEQLLKETGARLPLLNVELPLLGFYAVVPWLVLVFHFHLLNQFYLLSRKLHDLNDALIRLPAAEQSVQRNLPFPLVFSHLLVGTHHSSFVRFAFGTAVVVTIAVVPVLVLLSVQLRFLPYHSFLITFSHQLAVTFALGALWAFGPRLVSPSGYWDLKWTRKIKPHEIVRAGALGTAIIGAVSFFLLAPPGTGIEFILGKQVWLDSVLHRHLSLPERTLVRNPPAPELLAVLEADATEEGKSLDEVWLRYAETLILRNRNLSGARFEKAKFWDTDFRGANLEGAKLNWAHLKGANLEEANLEGASLNWANLEGANLGWANLKWAELTDADLSFVDLTNARNLETAELAGADYVFANGLEGTILDINQPPPDVLPAP